jgi:steroid 5-alpha reductase family enzyme
MNLFKTIIKWCGIILFTAFAYAATLPEPIKVYLIVSSRSGEYTIEKIYLRKENAEKYCEMFKDSHNYVIEERKLTE